MGLTCGSIAGSYSGAGVIVWQGAALFNSGGVRLNREFWFVLERSRTSAGDAVSAVCIFFILSPGTK